MNTEKSKKPLEIKKYGFQDHNPGDNDIITFTDLHQTAEALSAKRNKTGFITITILVDHNFLPIPRDKHFLYVKAGTPIKFERKRLIFIESFSVIESSGNETYRHLFEIK